MNKVVMIKWNDGMLNGVVFSNMDKALTALKEVVGEGPFIEVDDDVEMNFDELVDYIRGNVTQIETDTFCEMGDDYVEMGIFEVNIV